MSEETNLVRQDNGKTEYQSPVSTIITIRQSYPLMQSQNEHTSEDDLF